MTNKVSDDPTTKTLLYRNFKQFLTDYRIERAVFQAKSDDLTGPKMYFQNKEYRIEQFFHGRPLSIWEMRNPMIYLKYAETICEYNFSDQVTRTISEISPMDPKNLFIH